MKQELIAILVCPVCKAKLELNTKEESMNEIVTGYLYCHNCDNRYPIIDSIPQLLLQD